MNKSDFVGIILIDCDSALLNLNHLEAKENSPFRSLLLESEKKLNLEKFEI